MGTFNIFSYNNGADDDDPIVIVELNDDDTEIVKITSVDPEGQAEVEDVLMDYIAKGATPAKAMSLFAGSYGQVWPEGADRTGAGEETGSGDETEGVEAPDVTNEPVSAAVEDETAVAEGMPADQITSGATMALVDDNGVVITLFRADENGDYMVRKDGEWTTLVDPTTIDNLSFVGVNEDSTVLYDEYQGNDNLVPIKFYELSAEGPYWNEVLEFEDDDTVDEDEIEDEDSEEALAASVVLDGIDDLDTAIAAAVRNEDLRWFVERRVAALGLEAALPWLRN